MLLPDKAFVMYANCKIIYDGRAYSTLNDGNYLITNKNDNSVAIYGGNLNVPRNYMGAKSNIIFNDNIIYITNKKESIKILINKIHFVHYLENWSINKINISRTEKELTQKIIANPVEYDIHYKYHYEEYKTEHGPIDLLFSLYPIDNKPNKIIIIELKRKQATLNACIQLEKYMQCFIGEDIKGCVAAPKISMNALKYCDKKGIRYIEVNHEERDI